MLCPTKHTHPDRTVINMSLILLTHIKSCRLENYDNLRKFAKKMVDGGDVLFMPALNFLYLLGLIDYQPKTDTVEYIGLNDVI